MLFRNTDVKISFRISLCKRSKAGPVRHGSADRSDLRILFRQLQHRFRKNRRIAYAAGSFRFTRREIESAYTVKCCRSVLGRAVAPALLGHHMDHDRLIQPFDRADHSCHLFNIMSVDRTDIFDSEILEKAAFDKKLAYGVLGTFDISGHTFTDFGDLCQALFYVLFEIQIGILGAKPGQMSGKSADILGY